MSHPVPMTANLEQLRAWAAEQADLLSRGQCVAAGLSPSAIRWRQDSGRWMVVRPGVYLTRPGRHDTDAAIWASLLAADPRVDPQHVRAAVAGQAAAYLWRLTREAPAEVELVVPRRRVVVGISPAPRRLADFERRVVRTLSPPRTSLVTTVLDCAAAGSADDALHWVARAIQQRRTTTARIADELEVIGRHPHGALLRECLTDIAAGAESPAEVRYIRDVERAHGLPAATRQAQRFAGRHDNLYEEFGLIVEVDGRLGHEAWSDRVADGRRDRRAALDTGTTTRVFWPDVATTACKTAVEIGAMLALRGWDGRVRACRRPTCAVRLSA